MKFKLLLLIISLSLFIQCSKELEEGDSSNIPTDLTTISQGTFGADAHATSGTVKLAKDAADKRYLVFENLKSDAGPDIRIWMAEDKTAKNYVELSNKVALGSYKLDVPTDLDATKKSWVLIWCKQFSVLFGSAQLK